MSAYTEANTIVWDLYVCYGEWPGRLVVRISVSCIIMISSLSESVGIVITWKLYDWYGLIHFTFLLLCILLLIRNIVSWNPHKSSDFHSILVDFTFVYCEICGFQLNPQYFNLNLQLYTRHFGLLSIFSAPGTKGAMSDSGQRAGYFNDLVVFQIICNILLWNPCGFSDFYGIFAISLLYIVKSMDFS